MRGMACVFLVAFHVIGFNSNEGLKIDSGLYREVNDLLVYLRMPLFTFLSGIVYSFRPLDSNIRAYVKGKFRRLIVPMLIVGTLFAVIQAFTPGSNTAVSNWYMLHILPVGHFWFIESLFLIFMLLIPLEYWGILNKGRGFLLAFLVSVALYVSSLEIPYFSISGAIYLLPYFLLGMGFNRYHIWPRISRNVGIFLFCSCFFVLVLIYTGLLDAPNKRSYFALAIGSAFCVALLAIRLKLTPFARLGFFSYSIYIYHVFFTAATRIVLHKLDVDNTHLIFIISLFFGLLGPILVEIISSGTNFSRAIFLGKSKTKLENLWLSRKLKYNQS
jgi:hypothetical protein